MAAFTGEKKEALRYEDKLDKAMATSIRAGVGWVSWTGTHSVELHAAGPSLFWWLISFCFVFL